jgi:hypothetical protein
MLHQPKRLRHGLYPFFWTNWDGLYFYIKCKQIWPHNDPNQKSIWCTGNTCPMSIGPEGSVRRPNRWPLSPSRHNLEYCRGRKSVTTRVFETGFAYSSSLALQECSYIPTHIVSTHFCPHSCTRSHQSSPNEECSLLTTTVGPVSAHVPRCVTTQSPHNHAHHAYASTTAHTRETARVGSATIFNDPPPWVRIRLRLAAL